MYERLRTVIARQFSVSEDAIGMDTSFQDDLGADSLDIIELNLALEEVFDVQEYDEEAIYELVTVGDVFQFLSANYD